MPVWGGCDDYLTRALQVIHNKVARSVTKRNTFTPTKMLMNECSWLTVKQFYPSLIQLHKTIQNQTPTYLYSRVSSQLSLLENLLLPDKLVVLRGSFQELSQDLICQREVGVREHHTLPERIKGLTKLSKFKAELKTWVKQMIET